MSISNCRQLVAIVLLAFITSLVQAQTESYFLPPGLKFELDNTQWKENPTMISYADMVFDYKSEGIVVNLDVSCSLLPAALSDGNFNPSKVTFHDAFGITILDKSFKVNDFKCFKYSYSAFILEGLEDSIPPVFCSCFKTNDQYIAEVDFETPKTHEKALEKIVSKTLSAMSFISPAEMDKQLGLPISRQYADSVINEMVEPYMDTLQRFFDAKDVESRQKLVDRIFWLYDSGYSDTLKMEYYKDTEKYERMVKILALALYGGQSQVSELDKAAELQFSYTNYLSGLRRLRNDEFSLDDLMETQTDWFSTNEIKKLEDMSSMITGGASGLVFKSWSFLTYDQDADISAEVLGDIYYAFYRAIKREVLMDTVESLVLIQQYPEFSSLPSEYDLKYSRGIHRFRFKVDGKHDIILSAKKDKGKWAYNAAEVPSASEGQNPEFYASGARDSDFILLRDSYNPYMLMGANTLNTDWTAFDFITPEKDKYTYVYSLVEMGNNPIVDKRKRVKVLDDVTEEKLKAKIDSLEKSAVKRKLPVGLTSGYFTPQEESMMDSLSYVLRESKGQFKIEKPKNDEVLIISDIGYEDIDKDKHLDIFQFAISNGECLYARKYYIKDGKVVLDTSPDVCEQVKTSNAWTKAKKYTPDMDEEIPVGR